MGKLKNIGSSLRNVVYDLGDVVFRPTSIIPLVSAGFVGGLGAAYGLPIDGTALATLPGLGLCKSAMDVRRNVQKGEKDVGYNVKTGILSELVGAAEAEIGFGIGYGLVSLAKLFAPQ